MMTKEEMTREQIEGLLNPLAAKLQSVATAAQKVSEQLKGVALQFREVERAAILELLFIAGSCTPASAQRPSEFISSLGGGAS